MSTKPDLLSVDDWTLLSELRSRGAALLVMDYSDLIQEADEREVDLSEQQAKEIFAEIRSEVEDLAYEFIQGELRSRIYNLAVMNGLLAEGNEE
jgi:hypothetical protein